MYKVIVERPRRGGFHSSRPPYQRHDDRDDERQRESLKFRHRHDPKWLNENLRPLERYLERQIGRRWDFVYSELCARVDRRNTVQQHIHQHIDDFVAIQVLEIDGEFHVMQHWGGMAPLGEVRQRLYVDPRNGCLMRNETAVALGRQRHRAHCLAVQARQAGWQAEVRTLDERTQLRRIDGIWYEVELAPVPPRDEPHKPGQRKRSLERLFAFDALTHKRVDHCNGERCRRYGKCSLYARCKRQLSRTELLEHGLRNGSEPDTYAASLRPPARAPGTFKSRAQARSGARNKEH